MTHRHPLTPGKEGSQSALERHRDKGGEGFVDTVTGTAAPTGMPQAHKIQSTILHTRACTHTPIYTYAHRHARIDTRAYT